MSIHLKIFTFIIFGNVANLGVFNLKSHVITAGRLNYKVYAPPSISLSQFTCNLFTTTYFSLIEILDAKVA